MHTNSQLSTYTTFQSLLTPLSHLIFNSNGEEKKHFCFSLLQLLHLIDPMKIQLELKIIYVLGNLFVLFIVCMK